MNYSLLLALVMPLVLLHEGLHEQIQKINLRIEQQPGDARLYLKRAELYRLHHDWKLAQSDLDQVAHLAPGLAEQRLERALLLQQLGHHADALLQIESYLELHPLHTRALATKAQLLFLLNRYEASAQAFEACIVQLKNPQPDHYFDWARALEACKERGPERALLSIEIGLERLGACMPLELLAVEFESKLHRPEAALKRLDRISEGIKRQESWLIRRGDVLWDNQQIEQARLEYQAALLAIHKLRPRTRGTRAVEKLRLHAQQRLETGPF
jgi:tetratricopeptide (TPR) repeat protein